MSRGLSRKRVTSVEGIGISQADLPLADAGRIDPREWFDAPDHALEIEIGSGKGTFLVQQAAEHPEVNYLGIEWAAEFYRYAADRARRHQLTNVRILHGDASEFLRFWCADGVARVVHLYFSDPWPKKRHHKRRVIQDETLASFHRVLQPGGEVRIVTDHDDLWAWCLAHAERHRHLFAREPFQPPSSAQDGEMVGTNFERKYAREGRPFHAMTLRRVESAD